MSLYKLIELENSIITQGINYLIGKEFSINKGSYSKDDIIYLIDYVLDYLKTENKTIQNFETFGYGSWMFQFVYNGIYIELHELKDDLNGKNVYEFDLSLTINFFKDQAEICRSMKSEMNIPKLGQKIALSPEIYEGREASGVRYNAPIHMTGWYLTSNSYNGDIKSLVVDHLYHLLKLRPDLAKYLALPAGYRFYKDEKEEEVWFDVEVTKAL